MRLFHISEEKNINEFKPRPPLREDLKDSPPLVWAIDERRMVNFFTPRNCPRLTYHIGEKSSQEDIANFFSDSEHVLIIEHNWLRRMQETRLYVYEFETKNFYLQDEIAGYYVSESVEKPICVHIYDDLFKALEERHIEVRLVNELWTMREKIINSSLNYSLCRMKYVKK